MNAGHDWRLGPIAAGAWVGAWLGTLGAWPLPAGLLVVAAAVGLVVLSHVAWRRSHWIATAGVVLIVVALLAGVRSVQLHHSLPARLAQDRSAAEVVVEVVGDPRLPDTSGHRPPLAVGRGTLVELRSGGHYVRTTQPIAILASGHQARAVADAEPGGRYELTGILAPADRTSPEALLLRVERFGTMVAPPSLLDEVVNGLRAGLRQATAHSPPEQAALVPSLVVGDTSAIDDGLTASFRDTSLSHLLAVSGANLTLLLGVVLTLVRVVGLQGWWVRGAALACVAFFVVLCRSEPSVVRAAAMGLVALAAMGTGTGRRSLRHLFVAVTGLMLVDPWLARSWGLALSAAACAGIAVWLAPWTDALSGWVPRWFAEALALPLAAQLATQPLVTALNGQVSVVGVLANMLAGPFVGPGTILGMAATVMVWLPPAATALAWLAGWCVQPIIWIAAIGADLPGASRPWPATTLGIALLVVAVAAIAVLVPTVLGRPVRATVMAGLSLLALLLQPTPHGWPRQWQAVFCDVGQGDATLLRAGPGDAVLVDAGPAPAPTLACLRQSDVRRVPLLVVTHFHADHVGGAVEIITRYRPTHVVISPWEEPAGAARAVRAAAGAVGSVVHVAEPGQVWLAGSVRMQVVGASVPHGAADQGPGESSAENNASVVVVVEVDGLRLLLAGDAEPEAQRRVLQDARESGVELAVDVLKLPHHGSSRQEEEFFDATGASLAVASAGEDNDYGHPSRAALAMAVDRGMQLARTDQQGSVAITRTAGSLQVVTSR